MNVYETFTSGLVVAIDEANELVAHLTTVLESTLVNGGANWGHVGTVNATLESLHRALESAEAL